jgi:hypothetical protein
MEVKTMRRHIAVSIAAVVLSSLPAIDPAWLLRCGRPAWRMRR